MTYRFIGSRCELGNGVVLERFGQAVELSEEEAHRLLLPDPASPDRGAALLPEAEFAALGFTGDELSEYYAPPLHSDAPEEFRAKRDAAWQALLTQRQILAAEAASKEL